jgi:hypothetical protein
MLDIKAGDPASQELRALWQNLTIPNESHLADTACLTVLVQARKGRTAFMSM